MKKKYNSYSPYKDQSSNFWFKEENDEIYYYNMYIR